MNANIHSQTSVKNLSQLINLHKDGAKQAAWLIT